MAGGPTFSGDSKSYTFKLSGHSGVYCQIVGIRVRWGLTRIAGQLCSTSPSVCLKVQVSALDYVGPGRTTGARCRAALPTPMIYGHVEAGSE